MPHKFIIPLNMNIVNMSDYYFLEVQFSILTHSAQFDNIVKLNVAYAG